MAQEGYQCSQCWANGDVFIVTTVDAFHAHMAEVHGGENVMEVAENEVLLKEGDVSGKYVGFVEEMVGDDKDTVLNIDLGNQDKENLDIDTNEGNHSTGDKGEGGYICSICQNGFVNEVLLEEHKRDHPTCPICFTKLLSRAHYKDHIEEHPNCGHCGVKVVNDIELENHLLEHVIVNSHGDMRKCETANLSCGVDEEKEETMRRPVELLVHQSTAQVAAFNSQTYGGSAGGDIKHINLDLSLANPELEVELVTQMSEPEPPVPPEEKAKSYASSKIPSVSADEDKVYPLSLAATYGIFELSVKCRFCSETFPSMEELSEHVAQEHTDGEEDPSNRVKVGAGLEQKMIRPRVQDMSANPPFFCNACPEKKEFQKVLHLKRHVDKDHPIEVTGDVQFQCHLCKHLPFLQLDTLQRHMGVEHGNVMKHTYTCPLCEWSGEGLGRGISKRVGEGALKLRDHMRRHDAANPRPFGCSICKGSFFINSVLFTHTKKCDGTPPEDSGSKLPKPAVSITLNPENEGLTFRCVKCAGTFSSHEVFASHPCNLESEGIHKYHCAECGDTFEAKNDFKRHSAACQRNMNQDIKDGKGRQGTRKPRKRKVFVEPQGEQLQKEKERGTGFQLFADHNLNNFVGFGIGKNMTRDELEAAEAEQGQGSIISTAPDAASWECKACYIHCNNQVVDS